MDHRKNIGNTKMMKLKRWAHETARTCVLALAAGMSLTSQAAIVYNNGAPDQVYGTQMSEFQVADNFTIGTAANIDNIRFWSIQSAASDYSDSVYWAIYSNVAGQPGVVVQGGVTAAVAETATGLFTGFGYAEYVFNIPVAFTLGAGDYWLGLHNGLLASINPTEMLWSTTAISAIPTGLYFDGNWIDSGNEQAFLLEGTRVVVPPPGLPEPGTLTLLAAGLAAAAVFRRRNSGKKSTIV